MDSAHGVFSLLCEDHKELGILTKDKSKWEENIPYAATFLCNEAAKIKAKSNLSEKALLTNKGQSFFLWV